VVLKISRNTLSFKSFEAAEATIAAIELHRMLKKDKSKMQEKLRNSFMSLLE
jgi:transposase-like protein